MASSDGKTRSLVSDIAGQGWDFGMARHRYHEIERPLKPHYTVYNRRFMACHLETQSVEDGYWLLRRKAAVLHTGEYPLQFEGPDAERLLDKLFTKNIAKVKPGRCGYGLACYEDGGLITDGVLLRLAPDRFWYAQADGDFYSWARAHAVGMDVGISDPQVFVSQVQGPNALKILEAAAEGGLPEKFTYFAQTRVRLGGQDVVITRTGYTNELGWEFYTEPHHDAEALWAHLVKAGEPHGMAMHGLDSMNIRRIEAGILNAGSDFDETTNPYEMGLGRFVDQDKADFIGRQALATAPRGRRLSGLICGTGEPMIGGAIEIAGKQVGHVTAGAMSPYLKCGIGIARLHEPELAYGTAISIACTDGKMHDGELAELPLYDKQAEIPRGKTVDIPA